MAHIHELYGRLAEQHAKTEENLSTLKNVLQGLKAGRIDLDQIEFTPGGFKVNPKPEPPEPEADEETEDS